MNFVALFLVVAFLLSLISIGAAYIKPANVSDDAGDRPTLIAKDGFPGRRVGGGSRYT